MMTYATGEPVQKFDVVSVASVKVPNTRWNVEVIRILDTTGLIVVKTWNGKKEKVNPNSVNLVKAHR